MPDARVQAAIDNWASRLHANGRRLQRLRRITAARIERWDDWLDAWRATGRGHASRPSAGARRRATVIRRRGVRCRRRSPTTSRSSSGCSTPSATAPCTGARSRAYAAHRLLDPASSASRRRSTAAPRRQPAPPARGRAAAARHPHPGPGLDEGGVLPLGGRLPAPRHGDAVDRRPRPGRGGFELTIRPDYEVAVAAMLDALGRRATTSTSSGSAPSA